jgi:hypothetical protein
MSSIYYCNYTANYGRNQTMFKKEETVIVEKSDNFIPAIGITDQLF